MAPIANTNDKTAATDECCFTTEDLFDFPSSFKTMFINMAPILVEELQSSEHS
jgi:hypothetical protein